MGLGRRKLYGTLTLFHQLLCGLGTWYCQLGQPQGRGDRSCVYMGLTSAPQTDWGSLEHEDPKVQNQAHTTTRTVCKLLGLRLSTPNHLAFLFRTGFLGISGSQSVGTDQRPQENTDIYIMTHTAK